MAFRKISCALAFFALLSGFPADARELKFHGPFLQWHRDPSTTATFTWVERLAPDLPALPVWRDGRAGFGYGDGDDNTELPDMEDNYSRIYIAKGFDLDAVPADAELILNIRYDDAFVAWINGVEIARSPNLKRHHAKGEVDDSHEADEPEIFVIRNPGAILQKGRNLIAIEGHNVRESSSDLTLDPVLTLGDVALAADEDEWLYLAGTDPSTRWFLKEPSLSPLPELPKADESDWSLGIRRRGSDQPFQLLDIEERELAETGNPVFHGRAKDLEPGASYEFLLAAEERPVRLGWFRTAPSILTDPLEFVVGGDMGTTTAVPVCKRAGREDPLFALVGGDLAYANGRDAWRWYDWIDNWTELVMAPDGRSIPIIAGIGNHEMKGVRTRKSNAPFYFSLFDLPDGESNFTVDFGDYLSIILLDSNHAQEVDDQTAWLERELGDRQNVNHLFAIYHRPAWGTGIKRNIGDIQEEWSPLFEKYAVDCVFENDHHVYKRSHRLTDGRRDDRNGILYLGDGAWGAKLREIKPETLRRVGADKYLAKWKSIHHLIKVKVAPDGSRKFQAISADGVVFDQYRDSGTGAKNGNSD